MDGDPFDQARQVLSTAVGTAETELRERLGNERYETYAERLDSLEVANVASAHYQAEVTRQQGTYIKRKAEFWEALTKAVEPVPNLVGVGIVALAAVMILKGNR